MPPTPAMSASTRPGRWRPPATRSSPWPAGGNKLTPSAIREVLDFHTDEHMVRPRLVYISNSTEIGAFTAEAELEDLADFAGIMSYTYTWTGARLGSALTARGNDLSLEAIAQLTDAFFYIGGTKNSALIGEALVICRPQLKKTFALS